LNGSLIFSLIAAKLPTTTYDLTTLQIKNPHLNNTPPSNYNTAKMPAATSSNAVAPNGGMKTENSKSAKLFVQRLFFHLSVFYT